MRVVLEADRDCLVQLEAYLEHLTDKGIVSEYYFDDKGQATLYDIFDIKSELAEKIKGGHKMAEDKLNDLSTKVLNALWEDEEFQDDFGELLAKKINKILKGDLL